MHAQIAFCTNLFILKLLVLLFYSHIIIAAGSLLVACYECGFMCATRLPSVTVSGLSPQSNC